MKHKKPSRRELARRQKITKFYEDHPEARAAKSQHQTQLWTPERRRAKSEEVKQFYRAHPERREAASKRQKGVMRDPKRLKINSTTMKRLKADPEFEARRLAAIKAAESFGERKARRRATLEKTLAVVAIKNRRLRSVRKATSTRAYREGMSANKTKFWADLRARLESSAATTKTGKRGRKSMDKRNNEIVRLRDVCKWPWSRIAIETEPNLAKNNLKVAKQKVRSAYRRVKKRAAK
jgi:hypothetical protein